MCPERVALGERVLVRAWQRGLRRPLETTDGRQLSVVFRGRCLGGAGPDVRGAILAFDGGHLVEGDVEFHLRSADWRGHRHDRDPRYRAVVLHVVLEPDGPPPPDARGDPLPTLVLRSDDLAGLAENGHPTLSTPETCHRRARERGDVVAVLDELGDRRLVEKAARFEAELTHRSPEALAYEAVFDALGFSHNREPFARLARAVPAELLSALLGRRPTADALLLAQAILFGVAGLLPSRRPSAAVDWEADEVVEELETVWALYRGEWDGFNLDLADWTFGGVRAANYPTRRVATAAHLVVRYRTEGFDAAFLAPLRRGNPKRPDLEDLFVVDAPDDYWATHCDFGQRLPGGPASLLGTERARDAVVNVALPLALAVAAHADERSLADTAWQVYRSYPRPAAYGITRALSAELGLVGKQTNTARRQQGLLYLSRNHCERAACEQCPLADGGPAV